MTGNARTNLSIAVALTGVLFVVSQAAGAPASQKSHQDSAGSTPGSTSGSTSGSKGNFMRGMTVSCPTNGPIWGSPHMTESLSQLKELGVEWVAIHPYAGVRRDGSINVRPAAETKFLGRATELAKASGIELFWKPHLAYWGSFEWRGEIEFGDRAKQWQRFFSDYERFIVDQARFAESRKVPLFAVGVELEATTGQEQQWRRIIAEVRKVYSGRITYGANWDRLHLVPFWDAVDLIGVQAYFPLSRDRHPDRAAILAGWEKPLAMLRQLSERQQRPVLFTEIGYDLSSFAATEPWKPAPEDNAANRALRQRLMNVALERIEQEEWIHGIYWWKWIPGKVAHHDRDFSMRDRDAQAALKNAWAAPSVPAAASSSKP